MTTTKLIGEVVVNKLATHKGDDIFTVGLRDSVVKASVSNGGANLTASAQVGSIIPSREWVVRVNGFFKAAAGFYPGAKEKIAIAEGFFNILTGGGSSSVPTPIDLQPVFDKLNQISAQVMDVKNSITDIAVGEAKKAVELKLTENNSKMAKVGELSELINGAIQSHKNNIDQYLDKVTVENSVFKGVGFDGQLKNLNGLGFIADNQQISYAQNAFTAILNEQSTDSRRVNLIQRNMYYNAVYTEYFMDSILILRQAAEVEKIIAFLSSSTGGSKYHDSFNFATTSRVIKTRSYEQNLEAINNYYVPLIAKLMVNIDPKNLQAPYEGIYISEASKKGASWYDPSTKTIDLPLFAEKTGFIFDYYDKYTLKGTWGGKDAKGGWESSGFNIPYSDWSGTVISNGVVGAYMPTKYANSMNGKKGFSLFDSRLQGRSSYNDIDFNWKAGEQWGYSYNTRYIKSNILSVDQLYKAGDFSRWEKNTDHQSNMFDIVPKMPNDTATIVMTRPTKDAIVKHNNPGVVTGVFAAQANGPDGKSRFYTFGVNVFPWKSQYTAYDPDADRPHRWHSNMGWEGVVFCVSPNCQERDGRLVYSDGSWLKMYNPNGNNTDPVIKLSKYAHLYKVKPEFITHNQDVYSEPKIYNINSGSHDLRKNIVYRFGDDYKVATFRYKYKIVNHDNSKSDYPEFDLRLENNYCNSYDTKVVNSLKTCVYESDGVYTIKTMSQLG